MNISLCSPPNLFRFVGTGSDISSRFIFVPTFASLFFFYFKVLQTSSTIRVTELTLV